MNDRLRQKQQLRRTTPRPKGKPIPIVHSYNPIDGTYVVKEGKDLIYDCRPMRGQNIAIGQPCGRRGKIIVAAPVPKPQKTGAKAKADPPKPVLFLYSLEQGEDRVWFVGGYQKESVEVFRTPLDRDVYATVLNNLGSGNFTIDISFIDRVQQWNPSGLEWEIETPIAQYYYPRGHGFWVAKIGRNIDPSIPEATEPSSPAPSAPFSPNKYERICKIWQGVETMGEPYLWTIADIDESGYGTFISTLYDWALPSVYRLNTYRHETYFESGAFIGQAIQSPSDGTYQNFERKINVDGTRTISWEYTSSGVIDYETGVSNYQPVDYCLLIEPAKETKFRETAYTSGNPLSTNMNELGSGDNSSFWLRVDLQVDLLEDSFAVYENDVNTDIEDAIANGESEITRDYQLYSYEFEKTESIEAGAYIPQDVDDTIEVWASSYHP